MRGSRIRDAFILPICGIIPAHAGLTRMTSSASMPRWDHPRACGAHRISAMLFGSAEGSSPRMRGSLREILLVVAEDGIIPAHAGLTRIERFQQKPGGDHPRACGAHSSEIYNQFPVEGSSPRMRGSPEAGKPKIEAAGIIPAHAGLTLLALLAL